MDASLETSNDFKVSFHDAITAKKALLKQPSN